MTIKDFCEGEYVLRIYTFTKRMGLSFAKETLKKHFFMSLSILIAHVHILKMYILKWKIFLSPITIRRILCNTLICFYMRLPFVNMRGIFKFHNIYVKLQDNYVIMHFIYLIINDDYDNMQNIISTCVLCMSTCD